MLQLGWKAGPEQFQPTELLDYAVKAEQAGFDLIDVSDHFNPWSEAGQATFTWTWLGAAATRTNRIHLGPCVTCPILRYHPVIIAQAAATVSCFAPGRTYLGFDHLIFHSASPDQGAFVQAFGHNVLPRLRAKSAR